MMSVLFPDESFREGAHPYMPSERNDLDVSRFIYAHKPGKTVRFAQDIGTKPISFAGLTFAPSKDSLFHFLLLKEQAEKIVALAELKRLDRNAIEKYLGRLLADACCYETKMAEMGVLAYLITNQIPLRHFDSPFLEQYIVDHILGTSISTDTLLHEFTELIFIKFYEISFAGKESVRAILQDSRIAVRFTDNHRFQILNLLRQLHSRSHLHRVFSNHIFSHSDLHFLIKDTIPGCSTVGELQIKRATFHLLLIDLRKYTACDLHPIIYFQHNAPHDLVNMIWELLCANYYLIEETRIPITPLLNKHLEEGEIPPLVQLLSCYCQLHNANVGKLWNSHTAFNKNEFIEFVLLVLEEKAPEELFQEFRIQLIQYFWFEGYPGGKCSAFLLIDGKYRALHTIVSVQQALAYLIVKAHDKLHQSIFHKRNPADLIEYVNSTEMEALLVGYCTSKSEDFTVDEESHFILPSIGGRGFASLARYVHNEYCESALISTTPIHFLRALNARLQSVRNNFTTFPVLLLQNANMSITLNARQMRYFCCPVEEFSKKIIADMLKPFSERLKAPPDVDDVQLLRQYFPTVLPFEVARTRKESIVNLLRFAPTAAALLHQKLSSLNTTCIDWQRIIETLSTAEAAELASLLAQDTQVHKYDFPYFIALRARYHLGAMGKGVFDAQRMTHIIEKTYSRPITLFIGQTAFRLELICTLDYATEKPLFSLIRGRNMKEVDFTELSDLDIISPFMIP
ncbi:MAG: hypothetical protein ACKVOH_01750 [Chlamydiales bacterium]